MNTSEIESEEESSLTLTMLLFTPLFDSMLKSLQLQGTIAKSQVQILEDSGSTLNFICTNWVWKLELSVDISRSFDVVMGNKECMVCMGIYRKTLIYIESTKFKVDLNMVPFHEQISL